MPFLGSAAAAVAASSAADAAAAFASAMRSLPRLRRKHMGRSVCFLRSKAFFCSVSSFLTAAASAVALRSAVRALLSRRFWRFTMLTASIFGFGPVLFPPG